ncbi:acyltransferase [Sphingomonas sp.]|uniref:acyltransferase family protein n=1 Tax=Sphingomonas sp. TaxID=28214 RepID=UPI0025DDDB5D|nr:acyltransferase [Sphingomonas sp.]
MSVERPLQRWIHGARPIADAAARQCPTQVASSDNKLLGLELLRFLAAMAVLFWHYNHFYDMVGSRPFVASAQPWHAWFWPFYDFGLFGVQLFWCISGFIFAWKYSGPVASGTVSGRQFFWLRFSRLYPLHLVTLLFVTALQPWHRAFAGHDFHFEANDPWIFAKQLFLASDWIGGRQYSFNGPIWSISAEIAVYFLFFLIVRRFALSLGLCVTIVGAALAAELAGIQLTSVWCLSYFFAGAMVALPMLKPADKELRKRRIVLAALTLFVILAVSAWLGALGDRAKMPMLMLLAGPPIVFLAGQDWSVLDRWQRPLASVGNLTYSSYLVHFPLQLILAIAVAASGITLPVTSTWFLLVYLGVVLGVSALVYQKFERPVQDRLRKLTVGKR